MSVKGNVLVLGGHLDDSVLAIGGIIKRYTNAGHKVSVVCFGCGDEGFARVEDRTSNVERFYHEAIKSHEILGVKDFVCHNWSDFAVNESKESYRLCIEAIRRVKPDVIFGHYWLEYFQHRAMARLSCDSWLQAGWRCSADLGEPWQARALYHFEVLQVMPEPTHIVDVSDTFTFKLDAWAEFKTGQEHLGSEFDKLEARARFYGSRIGVKYAEALTRSSFIAQSVRDPSAEL